MPVPVPFIEDTDRVEVFLEVLAETGIISRAALVARIHPQRISQLRREHPDFDQRCAAAIDVAADTLEEEIRRRAIQGVEEPVFYQGNIVGYTTRYSDQLAMFLMKSYRPERFRERPVVALGADDAPRIGVYLPENNRQPPALPSAPAPTEE